MIFQRAERLTLEREEKKIGKAAEDITGNSIRITPLQKIKVWILVSEKDFIPTDGSGVSTRLL